MLLLGAINNSNRLTLITPICYKIIMILILVTLSSNNFHRIFKKNRKVNKTIHHKNVAKATIVALTIWQEQRIEYHYNIMDHLG